MPLLFTHDKSNENCLTYYLFNYILQILDFFLVPRVLCLSITSKNNLAYPNLDGWNQKWSFHDIASKSKVTWGVVGLGKFSEESFDTDQRRKKIIILFTLMIEISNFERLILGVQLRPTQISNSFPVFVQSRVPRYVSGEMLFHLVCLGRGNRWSLSLTQPNIIAR